MDWVLYINDNSNEPLGGPNGSPINGEVPSNFSYASSSNGLNWVKHTFYTISPYAVSVLQSRLASPVGVVAVCKGDQIYVLFSTYMCPTSELLYSRGALISNGTIAWTVLNQVVTKIQTTLSNCNSVMLHPRRIVLDSSGNPWISVDQDFWLNSTLFIWEEVSGTWVPRYYDPGVTTGGTDSITPLQSRRMGLVYSASDRFVGVIWNGTEWENCNQSSLLPAPDRVAVTSSGDAIDVAFSPGRDTAGVYFTALSTYNTSLSRYAGFWSVPRKLVNLDVGPGCATGTINCFSDLAISADSKHIVILYTLTSEAIPTNEVDYCLSRDNGSNWSCDNRASSPETGQGFGGDGNLGANPTSNDGAFSMTWEMTTGLRYVRLVEPAPQLAVGVYLILAGAIILVGVLLMVGLRRRRGGTSKPVVGI